MVRCSVISCKSDSETKSDGLSFHLFPEKPELRNLWVSATGRNNWLPKKSSRMCCKHFDRALIWKRGKKTYLYPNAVPIKSQTEENSHLTECFEEADEIEVTESSDELTEEADEIEVKESSDELTEEADEIEVKESSDELMACRACLAVDGRLYSISGSGLEDALATFTGIAMREAECLPQHLCAFCRAVLAKCVAFRDRCQRSTALLQALLEKGPLKMSDITAINREVHQPTNNIARIKILQLVINPLPESKSIIKIEDIIEVENLTSKNDSNNADKYTSELSIEKREKHEMKTMKTGNHDQQFKIDKHIEINDEKCIFEAPVQKSEKPISEKVDTENHDKHLKSDDDIEISDDNDTSGVDTDSLEETINIRKKTAKIPNTTRSYVVPPYDDMKAFEKKYNVEYKFLNKDEQTQEIEERKSNNTLKYCCDMCGRGFRREHSMVNHLWIHDPRLGPHECAVCRKRFRSLRKLQHHRNTHRDRYTCRECGLPCRTRTSVKTHYKVHQGSSHACPYCSEVYARKTSYYNHIRTTHPERNEACDECGETFLSAAGVRLHKALAHRPTNIAILKCKDCDVPFSSAEALQRHEKLGSGVPHAALWACAACGDSCGSETALAKHAAERHPPEQLHCNKCDKTFANAASFSLHEARKHRGVRASIAPFRRIDKPERRRTPGTGPYRSAFVCEICGKKLQTAHYLEIHRNAHFGINPFSCPKCAKKFNSKWKQQLHMRVHTGERPYQCEQCPLAFSMRGNFTRHMKNVHLRVQVKCDKCGKMVGAASLAAHIRAVHLGQPYVRRKRDRSEKKLLLTQS